MNRSLDARRLAYELRRWMREERLSRRVDLSATPNFILGMQKSGTSAMAGLLALRTGVPVAIDLQREWRRSTIVKAAASSSAFERFVRRNATDFARPVVKEPGLTFVYERLLERWPSACVAIVVREPVATIRSVIERLGIPGDLPQLGRDQLERVPQPWRPVLDNRWLGVDCEHYIDQLAERWCLAAQLAIAREGGWFTARYEDFVADKIGMVDRMATHFDLPVVAEIDAFLDRPFQPRGARRDPEEVFGPNLERIVQRTEELAGRLGYAS